MTDYLRRGELMAQYSLSLSRELQTLKRTGPDIAVSPDSHSRNSHKTAGFNFRNIVKTMYCPSDGIAENNPQCTSETPSSQSPQIKPAFSSSRLSELAPAETARIKNILFKQWNPCDTEKSLMDASSIDDKTLVKGLRLFNRVYFNKDTDRIMPETMEAFQYLESGCKLIDYRDDSGRNPFAEKTSEGLSLYEKIRRQGLNQIISEPQKIQDAERLDVVAAARVLHNHGFRGTEQKLVKLASHIEKAAKTHNVDPYLITAVIAQESAFNPGALSVCGAQGLMQLMPGTAREQGVCDPFNIRENIMGGTRYLSRMLKSFSDVPKALAAYNAGPGSVQRYGGVPPYSETINYVSRISSIYKSFKTTTAGASSAR